MPSPASSSASASSAGAHQLADANGSGVRLIRIGVRVLVISAVVALVAAVLVAALMVLGGAQGIAASAVVLALTAVLFGVLAGFLVGSLRSRAGAVARLAEANSHSTTPAETGRSAGSDDGVADRAEAVSDDEIEAARSLFGAGTGPVDVDPSWKR